jgi:SAM-dependent methyltransferase
MKECLLCGATFSGMSWECPSCRCSPQQSGECLVFSPELADTNDGFERTHFERLSCLEAKHFWFESRNLLILWALQHYFPKGDNFLEIGCGTGFVLSAVERNFPSYALYGSEISTTGLPFAKRRLKEAHLFQMDARQIPFKEEFNIIGAFDVLEHIAEDEFVLSQIHKALVDGGGLILTVPQHPFLWSYWDEISHHKRRYTRSELRKKMEVAGFKVLWMTSFMALLLPALMALRLKWRERDIPIKKSEELKDLDLPPWLNSCFRKVCEIEGRIVKRGFSLPAGGSLLCVALKE